jgi:hypothetical protein
MGAFVLFATRAIYTKATISLIYGRVFARVGPRNQMEDATTRLGSLMRNLRLKNTQYVFSSLASGGFHCSPKIRPGDGASLGDSRVTPVHATL